MEQCQAPVQHALQMQLIPTGLVLGSANVIQVARLYPLLMQCLICSGESRPDMIDQPCTNLNCDEMTLVEQ